jgi:hypothetical protein
MPAANTRKVEIGGEATYLQRDEARTVELLARGAEKMAYIRAVTAELEEIKGELLEIAERTRDGKGTVRLYSPDGRQAKVKWERSIIVDHHLAEELRKQLGEAWDCIFSSTVNYSRARSFAAWMEAEQGPLEYLKAKVKKAFTSVDKRPSVRILDAGEAD